MKKIFQIIILSLNILTSQTAEQIKKAKDVIERSGMSENQIRDAAKSRGYTNEQIDNAIKKGKSSKPKSENAVSEINGQFELPDLGTVNEVLQDQLSSGATDIASIEDELEIVDESGLDIAKKGLYSSRRLSYFGYKTFAKDPGLFQATSVGAVDPDYLIGPGDEIIVMLWGETQFRQVLKFVMDVSFLDLHPKRL